MGAGRRANNGLSVQQSTSQLDRDVVRGASRSSEEK
jgi:hypothetical protein